jgi:cell division protein FtsQ
VTITEQQPVARWGSGALVNSRGELFRPDLRTFPPGLVALNGPPDSISEVWAQYGLWKRGFESLGQHVTAVTKTDRGDWVFVLNDHIPVLVGQADVEERVKRFEESFPQMIGEKINHVLRVDLRYPHGIAIQWTQ